MDHCVTCGARGAPLRENARSVEDPHGPPVHVCDGCYGRFSAQARAREGSGSRNECVDCGAPNTPVHETVIPGHSSPWLVDANGERVAALTTQVANSEAAQDGAAQAGATVEYGPIVARVRRCESCLRAVEAWKAGVRRARAERAPAVAHTAETRRPVRAREPADRDGSRAAALAALESLGVR